MNSITRPFAALALLLTIATFSAANPPRWLREVSVTVVVDDKSYGSGTLFVADGVTYCLTAAHVFGEDFRSVSLVQVAQSPDGNHKRVEMYAHPLKIDRANDLCLLRVGKGVWTAGARVHRGINLGLDAKVWHCGTYGGSMHHSVAGGRIQGVGNKTTGTLKDVADLTVTHGSSGGGMFDKEGRYIGMFTHMMGNRVAFFTPMRVIRPWLLEQKIDLFGEPRPKE